VSYTWDNNGDLTARGSDSFAWDYEDRQTSATVGGTTTTFAYRGDGLRNSRTTGGSTTTFTWDVNAGLPVVLDDGNQYVYGAGLAEMVSGGTTYYYLADGLGSTMAIVDTSGTVQKSYTYDVYGKPTATGSLANAYDFAGQETDGTGLQYLRARYMDPDTGRFLSRDPMSGVPDWVESGYGYAADSPCSLTDPTGASVAPGPNSNQCGDLWASIVSWIDHLNKKKSDYRNDARSLPEEPDPLSPNPYGSRSGHRAAYAGYQKSLQGDINEFDRLDCRNKKNRPRGFDSGKLGKARELAKEYQPLKKIEHDVDNPGQPWWDDVKDWFNEHQPPDWASKPWFPPVPAPGPVPVPIFP